MKKTPQTETEVRQIGRVRRLTKVRSQIPYWVIMLVPLLFFLLICYWPVFGLAISFQDYRIGDPFISAQSRWAGFKWFRLLFRNPNFPRLVRNTLVLNLLGICVSFPIAILFALLLNEVRTRWFRSLSANISLLPYFISTVVIVAIMYNIFSVDSGLVNQPHPLHEREAMVPPAVYRFRHLAEHGLQRRGIYGGHLRHRSEPL